MHAWHGSESALSMGSQLVQCKSSAAQSGKPLTVVATSQLGSRATSPAPLAAPAGVGVGSAWDHACLALPVLALL